MALYNLAKDPLETVNLLDPAQLPLTEANASILSDLQTEVNIIRQ